MDNALSFIVYMVVVVEEGGGGCIYPIGKIMGSWNDAAVE